MIPTRTPILTIIQEKTESRGGGGGAQGGAGAEGGVKKWGGGGEKVKRVAWWGWAIKSML